jgi:hypothetical protein
VGSWAGSAAAAASRQSRSRYERCWFIFRFIWRPDIGRQNGSPGLKS